MTGTNDKIRAVLLAAVMVLSVFAGTVAFAGSASAQSNFEYAGNAVHYTQDDGTAVIEVPFTDNVSAASLTASNFTVLDDGENQTSIGNADVTQPSDGRVIIKVGSSAIPSNDLEVDLSSQIADDDGDSLGDSGEKAVVFAGQTLEFEGVTSGSVTAPGNSSAYQGSVVAVNVSNVSSIPTNVDVTVEGEDNNYFAEGSTGENSTVFTFRTDNRDLGEYRVFIQNNDTDSNRTFVNVRDLQLDVSIDDLNVSNADLIEGTASAVAGGRNVQIQLIDSNDDVVNTSSVSSLNGQGEADFEFNAETADDGSQLSTGTYTVEVRDNTSGVTVESSEISVSEAADAEADFDSNLYSNQRGDVVELTVTMTETDTATVSFGSSSDGVRANATVEDGDGDNEVTLYLNTYNFVNGQDIYSLDSDSDDSIVIQNQDLGQLSNLIDAGDYDIDVREGSDATQDADNVATVTLEDRSLQEFRSWTAPDGTSVSDLEGVNDALAAGEISQSSEIANGDIVVHQLVGSGFEGLLDARDNEDVETAFFNSTLNNATGVFNLTVEEASPGANQEAKQLKLNTSNTDVIADGANDTYFVIFDTDNVDYKSSGTVEDDTQLEATFDVINNDDSFIGDYTPSDLDDDENESASITYDVVEPDISINEPYDVAQASGQTVTGTSTLAPTSELTVRIRSQSGTSPSFLKTASPEVQSDGTWNATFDFSGQSVGDEYDIEAESTSPSVSVEESGTVVESMTTTTEAPDTTTEAPDTTTEAPDTTTEAPDTTTEAPGTTTEPGTETPTSTPGFGVVVALTALIAAALLAIRRD